MAGSTIGSGIDVNTIVSQLMSVERQPLLKLQAEISGIGAEISALGRLRSSIDSFKSAASALSSASSLNAFKATSQNNDVLTASASAGASQGTYSVTVNELAQAHKLRTQPFPGGQSDVVGTGSMRITVDGVSMDLSVDASNNTVSGLRDAINQASNNPGVTASIIDGVDGSYLMLTSKASGAADAITIDILSDDDGNAADALGLSRLSFNGVTDNMVTVNQALDASLTIDGITVTSSTNVFDNVISGVSITAVDKNQTTTLSVGQDNSAISNVVSKFVEQYNALRSTLKSLHEKELKSGGTVRDIENGLNSVRSTSAGFASGFNYLSEIGVEIDKNGVMSLDSVKLNSALNSNLDGVLKLFMDETSGVGVRFRDMATDMLSVDGIIKGREDRLNSKDDLLDYRKDILENRLESIQKNYIRQYSALDSLVSSMNTQGYFLDQYIKNAPK